MAVSGGSGSGSRSGSEWPPWCPYLRCLVDEVVAGDTLALGRGYGREHVLLVVCAGGRLAHEETPFHHGRGGSGGSARLEPGLDGRGRDDGLDHRGQLRAVPRSRGAAHQLLAGKQAGRQLPSGATRAPASAEQPAAATGRRAGRSRDPGLASVTKFGGSFRIIFCDFAPRLAVFSSDLMLREFLCATLLRVAANAVPHRRNGGARRWRPPPRSSRG